MITEVTTHTDEARALLLEQFRGTVNFQRLLDSFVDQIQKLEAVIYDLLTEREIDAAVGTQLDNLGTIVGQAREGRNDTDYRIVIKARIRLNTGSGTPEDIIAVLTAITGQSVTLDEQPPAAFVVSPNAPLAVGTGTTIGKVLKTTKPAGVKAVLEYTEHSFATTFTMGDTSMAASAAQGFGDTGGTTGGYMATASEG